MEGGSTVKLVMAILQPSRLEAVKEALIGAGVQGMTVSPAEGFGEQKGIQEVYRGVLYRAEFVPRVKVECVVRDAAVERTVEAIIEAAFSGRIGDGKIFVLPVEEAVRIRTGERGDLAV